METLPKNFADAVGNVTIKDVKAARAIAAHTEVRLLLESDAELCKWGIDTILIGSYGRKTSRYPGKDVDVFLRFKNLTVEADPTVVYDTVRDVLVRRYGLDKQGGRVTEQDRSLKIDFSGANSLPDEGFSVDAVPAVVWGENWGIPSKDRVVWLRQSGSGRWVETNPVKFGNMTEELVASPSSPTVGRENAYRPIVRLMRQIRQTHLGDAKPGGLTVEVSTYRVWSSGTVTGDSYAEMLTNTLRAVANDFRACAANGMPDPVLGTAMQPLLDSATWYAAAQQFETLVSMATEALRADKCRAAKLWRDVLGSNDRGDVFTLPDGCDAYGFPIAAVTPVTGVGPNRARPFA